MKRNVLLAMSAFLLSATGPVFALTNQELACQLAQVGCPVEAKSFEHGITIKSENKSQDQFVCELAQVSCPPAAKNLEQKTTDVRSARSEIKTQDQYACELAQVSCPPEVKSL